MSEEKAAPTPAAPTGPSLDPQSGREATPKARPTMGGRGAPQKRRAQKSRYGVQMEEKQNLKKVYGIREQQLRNYYAHALRSKEQTGRQLITLLESRLDNAIYRSGFAPTRRAARQMSSHRFFAVNGTPVNIPSIQLRPGDMVTIRESKRSKTPFSNFEKKMQNAHTPSWLTLDVKEFGFRIQAVPTIEEANVGTDVQALVEFFAR